MISKRKIGKTDAKEFKPEAVSMMDESSGRPSVELGIGLGIHRNQHSK